MQHEEHEVSPSEDEQSVQDGDDTLQEDEVGLFASGVRSSGVQGGDALQENEVSPTQGGGVLKTLGILTIIFGIAIGIYLIVQFSQPAASTLFSESQSELTFGEVVIAIGVSLLFVVPGALCIGVGKVLALLEKDSA